MTDKKLKMDANPANIPWPTDKWGFTRELRKAVTSTASRMKGDPDKKALLDATLDVAIEFLEVNYASGAAEREKAVKRSIEQNKLYGKAVKQKHAEAKAKMNAPAKDPTQIDLFDEE